MDDADHAEILTSLFLDEQIRKARGNLQEGSLSRECWGSRLCEECGEEIPAARIEAVPGCRLCTDCQQDLEKKKERR